MPQRGLSNQILGIAAFTLLVQSQGASAQSQYMLRCDVTENIVSQMSGMEARTRSNQYQQFFTVNPGRQTVLQAMSRDQTSGNRVAIDQLVSGADITAETIQFCDDVLHRCETWTAEVSGGRGEFFTGPVLVNLASLRLSYQGRTVMMAGSRVFTSNRQATGTCVRE